MSTLSFLLLPMLLSTGGGYNSVLILSTRFYCFCQRLMVPSWLLFIALMVPVVGAMMVPFWHYFGAYLTFSIGAIMQPFRCHYGAEVGHLIGLKKNERTRILQSIAFVPRVLFLAEMRFLFFA